MWNLFFSAITLNVACTLEESLSAVVFFMAMFTLYIAHTLGKVVLCGFKLHVAYTLRYFVFAVLTLHMACT